MENKKTPNDRYRSFPGNNHGLTLMELIVASALIGIVMLGIVSVMFSITRFQQATNTLTILSSQVNAAMQYLSNDASLAVGDSTNSGLYTYSLNDAQSICFRQDTNDPTSFSDDTWTCFSHNNSFSLEKCSGLADADLTGFIDCSNDFPATTMQLLTLSQDPFFNIINGTQNGNYWMDFDYIELTLSSRSDRTQPVHPMTNPEYTLTTQINPGGYGR